MAARYWRLVFLSELACALALAGVLAMKGSPPWPLPALAALGVLLLCPWILVGLSFVLAWVMRHVCRAASNGSAIDTPRAGGAVDTLRAWVTETLAFERATLAMSIEPWRAWDFRGTARTTGPFTMSDGRGPVLLIHGVVCNRGVWRTLARKLVQHGFGPVRAINLEPLFADIDAQAAHVVSELRRLRGECSGSRISIVAHSMGGLVARAALRSAGAEDIGQLVTLGSPHHGTAVSAVLPNMPYRQMRIGSAWLEALNREQEGRLPVAVTTIYTLNDTLIVPAPSATLEGATSIVLRGIGHLGLLSARQSIDLTLATLLRDSVADERCHA